ncbi:MAG: hypothetical protein ACTHNE_07850, partial [Dyella sp.]|uniref:hypothetical protein n=1 Tax=Dyella sp. TaxID=1869338 RepID=UPI003F80C0CA
MLDDFNKVSELYTLHMIFQITGPSFPRKRRRFSTANAGQTIGSDANAKIDSRFRGNDGISGTYAPNEKTWGYIRVGTPTYANLSLQRIAVG